MKTSKGCRSLIVSGEAIAEADKKTAERPDLRSD